MRKPGIFRVGVTERTEVSSADTDAKRCRTGGRLRLLLSGIVMTPMLITGCGHFNESYQARPTFVEANDLFTKGSYEASLGKYREIAEKYPTTADRVLFEMGIIYAYPKNEQKDYRKSLESFQKLLKEYPESAYRQNSEAMIFNVNNISMIALKDRKIAAQKNEIEALRHEVTGRDGEIAALQQQIAALQKQIEALDKKAFGYLLNKPVVDRVLIDKGARRLSLLSNGEVLKTYRISLGGNPVGPKERQGDDKTPEGTYTIDARNRESKYHCSLHISYPNGNDRKRARELGVSPGGDIMIHGLKSGFEWVGDAQSKVDWTKGCIAVTDKEIEEIDKLVPTGTVVEIRP